MELLRQYRKSKKLSQVDLAKLIGVSQASLSDYENSVKRPRPNTASRISEITGISREYLIFGD